MKFVMTQAVCPEGMKLLDGIADIYVANDRDPNNYLDEMQNADAIIVRIAKMDANAIAHSPNLKVIGRTGVGYDTVDVAEATKRGIPVVVTPGANNRAVAEHSVAFMFALSKNLVESHVEQMKGNYGIRNKGVAFELQGKTVLVLGLGAIGREVAKICTAIGMKAIGYDPFLTEEQIAAIGCEPCKDYREALPRADVVTVHVPLMDSTRNMIDEAEIATMKKTALVINCARGGIINEKALAKALNEDRLGGAGIDCFEQDPPSVDNELMNAKNVIVSPHSAAQTKEAVVNMATMCVNGCLAICRGEKWPFVADKKVYDHPIWQGK